MPWRRFAASASDDARKESNAGRPRGRSMRCIPPPRIRSLAWISGGSRPMTSMPGTCINSLNCWNQSSTSPRATSVPTGTPGGACTMRGAINVGDAPALEQADKMRTARTRRIPDAAGAQDRVANRRLAGDVGPRRAGGYRYRYRRNGRDRFDFPDRRGRRQPTRSIASAASTTKSNASPSSTRRAASTPPTETIATGCPDRRS